MGLEELGAIFLLILILSAIEWIIFGDES